MKRIIVSQLFITFCLSLSGCNREKEQPVSPPNIVYILADDLGYGDVSAYHSEGKIETPHIDRLAERGMRFTDAHSPSSVCTPTRYAILTGRYPWRSRKPVGVLRGYSRSLIEPERETVAGMLKNNGYETAVIGKWHLGLDWQVRREKAHLLKNDDYGIAEEMDPEDIDFDGSVSGGPLSVGFDYSYILPASLDMPPYCYLENMKLVDKPTAHTAGSALETGYTGPFWRPGKVAPTFGFEEVLPTFISKAEDFISRQSDEKPFFLYLPLTGPHTPWLPDSIHRGKSRAGEYGDFVQQVDDAVGQVLDAIDKKGITGQTLVIFASDNGPFWREQHIEAFGHRAAGPFRGMKADAYEGGHRIPFIVSWPPMIKAGQVSHAPTTLSNLFATCAEIIGLGSSETVPEDSYSILSVLRGKADVVEDQPAIVHSASNGYYAVRKGDWKLIKGLGSGGFSLPKTEEAIPGGPQGQLFNLLKDSLETENVYIQHPDKVNELEAELDEIIKSGRKIVRKRE